MKNISLVFQHHLGPVSAAGARASDGAKVNILTRFSCEHDALSLTLTFSSFSITIISSCYILSFLCFPFSVLFSSIMWFSSLVPDIISSLIFSSSRASLHLHIRIFYGSIF